MVACYPSQAALLTGFQPRVERFRHAPAYDFSRPPKAGESSTEAVLPWTAGPRRRARIRLTCHAATSAEVAFRANLGKPDLYSRSNLGISARLTN